LLQIASVEEERPFLVPVLPVRLRDVEKKNRRRIEIVRLLELGDRLLEMT